MNLLVSVLLFLGVCLGDTVVLVFLMNYLYGCPFPKRALAPVRPVVGVTILAGWSAFAWLWWDHGFDWAALLAGSNFLVSGYIVVCWVMGFVVYPLSSWNNYRIRRAAVLQSNHTETVDVARELGFKPVGLGKHRLEALLPLNQCFQVDFSERTILLPQLPAAWDGLQILHLSDIHFSGTPDRAFYLHVIDRCRRWEPDLLAMTGDVVDTDKHHRWVLPVLGRLRWKTAAFAILGNHDLWHEPDRVRRRLRRAGMRVLGNGWETLQLRGEPLTVIGHEGPWFPPEPDLSACPAEPFRLCLSHTPDNIAWARRHHIDLVLAGHVHGGQIRLPGFGSIFVPSKYSRRYDHGTFHEPPTVMHVSRGLAGEHSLRYLCRPEVTLLVLRRGDPGAHQAASAV
jgi:predicted MPP superfamily phosphohydrolase